jgi:hypothetical protein
MKNQNNPPIIFVENSFDDELVIIEDDAKLLINIFNSLWIDVMGSYAISSLVQDGTVLVNKTSYYRDHYHHLYNHLKSSKSISYIIVFSSLLEKFYNGDENTLTLPFNPRSKKKIDEVVVRCLLLPSLMDISKSNNTTSGIKWEVYRKLKNFLKTIDREN